MKTGFSLLEILHKENPVFITGMGVEKMASAFVYLKYNIMYVVYE